MQGYYLPKVSGYIMAGFLNRAVRVKLDPCGYDRPLPV